jgi:hypothetical protein
VISALRLVATRNTDGRSPTRTTALPEWAEDRLETASSEQLQAWADAVLDAPSLEGALGVGA